MRQLLVILFLVGNIWCWSLNDIYNQLVAGNKRAGKQDASRSSIKGWGSQSPAPPNYELQSYDVEASPIKKNNPPKPDSVIRNFVKPTEGIEKLNNGISLMDFHKKFSGHKAQVSAWTEWSQRGSSQELKNHERAIKKHESAKPNQRAENEMLPTISTEQAKATAGFRKTHNTTANIAKTVGEMEPTKTQKHNVTTDTKSMKLEPDKPGKLGHRSETVSSKTTAQTTEYTQPEPVKNPAPSLEVPCQPTHDNLCPTSPVMIAAGQLAHVPQNLSHEIKLQPETPTSGLTKDPPTKGLVKADPETPTESRSIMKESPADAVQADASKQASAGHTAEVNNQLSANEAAQKEKGIPDLPDVHGLLESNLNQQTYTFHGCHMEATSEVCGVKVVVNKNTCDGKVSFTALIGRLLNNVDLSAPTSELIVHGKFDAQSFSIDRCKSNIAFNLTCRELLDVIPNKLRISRAKMNLNFSFEQIPKSIANFDIKINGELDLNFRSRRLNVDIDKPMGSTLFKIDMTTTDLELPEFTKLFTDAEISFQELPPDLATLVTSSLRNPRINGLYDESGAFEFLASAKSPASIFPSQPNVYVIIQKPRLGKVVSGLIASFDSAMFRSFLSSILNQDLSNIPLFNDVRTDMAVGISPDGLFVVKDDNFNKEVGTLFNTGKTIKKGLTVKARLPIRKMMNDASTKKNVQSYPETALVNIEVKGNKMHIEFPDDFQIPLSEIPELFAQHGQDMNFPKETTVDQTQLQVKSYEIDNIDKKSLSVYFSSNQPMKIGSLMALNNVGATLRRDELSKWGFEATGDYKLGTTSVSVSLKSKNDGFGISSNPSSIRSGLLVELLDQKRDVIKPEMSKYHMEDFVIEDFKVAGSINKKNIIRFSGKPAVFGVDDSKIEFIATEEGSKEDALAMGVLFRNVDLDSVFGRMLDRKMQRSSWATGVNIGLILSTPKNGGEMQFETEGLSRTKITPGAHLRCLLNRPEATLCKGDSLCRVLSEEMPHGSAFHLAGNMENGILKLSAPISDSISLSKALKLTDASLKVNVVDSVQIYLLSSLLLRGIGVPFSGEMRVDNTGQLQLNMAAKRSWEEPFGLKNIHFSQSNLSATFEPGHPLPVFEIRSRMLFGKDPNDSTKYIEAIADAKINSLEPSKNSFAAHLRDLSFEKLASACGTKKPLSRFQQEASFLEDGLLSFDQSKRDDIENANEGNDTDFNYKGDLKLTGRMHVLGQNAEYTVKFLHQESQLLTEVWLPDIGVNQGMLTIRAGLKQKKGEIETPNGPTLLVRMDPFMNSAVIVGKVSTLGFSRISAIKVEDNGFSAKIFGNLPGNINSDIALHSDYVDNIQNADFKAGSCLPIQQGVKAALIKGLQDTATKTKKTLISAEERVTTTEKIYETTKAMIDKNKKRSVDLTTDVRQGAEIVTKLKKGIKKHCVKDCGDSCMGLPTWKRSGISLAGRNAIGSPSWDSCKKKIPDLNCITRCLGRKVIENVKANNKQIELQGLMGQLADTKRSLQNARSLVDRARKLVDSTLDGLEKVNKEIKVGVDISKFLNNGKWDASVGVQNPCFQDSLSNAERSLVKFGVDSVTANETKRFSIDAALDGNLEQSLAEGIANQLYPGYFEFSKKLEQVKVLLSNLDGEKAEIEKAIVKAGDGTSPAEQKSQIIWNSEEDEFRKLAYGELPRFTLSDDETIHAFEEKSIWEIAPTNNPLFDQAPGDNQIMTNKIVNPDAFTEELNKQSNCGKIRSSVNRYGDIINPLSEFTENFLQEKIMFYRQKNRRLADLRMIDDQIKSDCFLENCTMEDMGNALSYLGRAREGTLKWSNTIESQIEQQNKAALGYFSKRTAEIIEVDKGVSLRAYIAKVKEIVTNAIKKSDIGEKSETDDKIQKLAKELHSLLVGVKNSEELSKVAPKIFSMKRQIQNLKRNKIPCTERLSSAESVRNTRNDTKLRVIKVNESSKNVTVKPHKTTTQPTKKEIPTSKKAPERLTTRPQPTETENPVLKDTVMRYDNNLINDHMTYKRTHAHNDQPPSAELDYSEQYAPKYFVDNQQENQQTYNAYPFWDRYIK